MRNDRAPFPVRTAFTYAFSMFAVAGFRSSRLAFAFALSFFLLFFFCVILRIFWGGVRRKRTFFFFFFWVVVLTFEFFFCKSALQKKWKTKREQMQREQMQRARSNISVCDEPAKKSERSRAEHARRKQPVQCQERRFIAWVTVRWRVGDVWFVVFFL